MERLSFEASPSLVIYYLINTMLVQLLRIRLWLWPIRWKFSRLNKKKSVSSRRESFTKK